MKRALLSVFDKTGITEFATKLQALGYELISTGGTLKVLQAAGLNVISIDEVTNFPEILDGRVKTLHPNVHGGLLARRDVPEHMATIAAHGIQPIDIVVVNLYPFKETIAKPDITFADAIEQIDIGGPSMLRSAAKNHSAVLPIIDPADYDAALTLLSEDSLTPIIRRQYAAKVFAHTAAYDALIADYLSNEEFPTVLPLGYDKFDELRYGENAHQQATAYVSQQPESYSILNANIMHGKKLSYNNLRDADAALRIAADFNNQPTVVTVKHMNPAGIGQADDILTAWRRAFAADDISIFGGIVVLNREVDLATAEEMHKIFLEIIIAPSYTDEAFDVLAKKKNLRILALPMSNHIAAEKDVVSILGGVLVQDRDLITEDLTDFEVVSKVQPTAAQLKAMIFAQRAVKHVKSNAIIVANTKQTLGVGAGQPNRIDSVKIAITKAQSKAGFDEAVLASDAFFPMGDSVQYAAENGITAIVEPGGSIKDQDSIDMADKLGIALVFSKNRHFKH